MSEDYSIEIDFVLMGFLRERKRLVWTGEFRQGQIAELDKAIAGRLIRLVEQQHGTAVLVDYPIHQGPQR